MASASLRSIVLKILDEDYSNYSYSSMYMRVGLDRLLTARLWLLLGAALGARLWLRLIPRLLAAQLAERALRIAFATASLYVGGSSPVSASWPLMRRSYTMLRSRSESSCSK